MHWNVYPRPDLCSCRSCWEKLLDHRPQNVIRFPRSSSSAFWFTSSNMNCPFSESNGSWEMYLAMFPSYSRWEWHTSLGLQEKRKKWNNYRLSWQLKVMGSENTGTACWWWITFGAEIFQPLASFSIQEVVSFHLDDKFKKKVWERPGDFPVPACTCAEPNVLWLIDQLHNSQMLSFSTQSSDFLDFPASKPQWLLGHWSCYLFPECIAPVFWREIFESFKSVKSSFLVCPLLHSEEWWISYQKKMLHLRWLLVELNQRRCLVAMKLAGDTAENGGMYDDPAWYETGCATCVLAFQHLSLPSGPALKSNATFYIIICCDVGGIRWIFIMSSFVTTSECNFDFRVSKTLAIMCKKLLCRCWWSKSLTKRASYNYMSETSTQYELTWRNAHSYLGQGGGGLSCSW